MSWRCATHRWPWSPTWTPGLEEGEGVTQAEVFEVFAANIKRLRDLVAMTIAALPAERGDDLCAHALDGITLPFDLP